MGPAFSLPSPTGPRSYWARVPARWDGRAALSLVVLLHGAGATAEWAMGETGWDQTADREGFLLVLPQGTRADEAKPPNFLHNPPVWNDGSPRGARGRHGVDDAAFLADVLDDVQGRYPIAGRACVTGFSNGAGMAFRLGAELPQRLAALAPVAGHCWVEPPPLARPLPTFYLVGDRDPLVPLAGGEIVSPWGRLRETKPSVRQTLARWAAALGCPDEPALVQADEGVVVERYGPGSEGVELIATIVEGLGHHWPGGRGQLTRRLAGPPSDRVRANDLIWEFFRRQLRR